MNEIEMLARISALENEIATMKAAKYDNLKEQAAQCIADKFRLDDSYLLLLESASGHLTLDESDSQLSVNRKLEDEFLSVCRRAHKPEPATPVGLVEAWAKTRADIAAADKEYARSIEKLVFKGNV